MTRWTAELIDRAQERRFRRYNLPLQRRTSMAALLAILLANLLSFGYTALLQRVPISALQVIVQAVVLFGGLALVVALLRVRRTRALYRTVVGAVLFLIAAVGLLIATGSAMGYRGSILLVGGVVVIYLSAPLTLAGATTMGLIFSAVTVPSWLLFTDALVSVDVTYTLVATLLAHVLSVIEARRAQQERRVLYAQREVLHDMSTADPLTGLVNRRAFDEVIGQAWGRWQAYGTPLSLLMVDIDHFKRLNDTFGHAVGDRYLQAVARTLRAVLPVGAGHVVARYGGEEFACLMQGVDAGAADRSAAEVLQAVRAISLTDARDGHLRPVTVSIGVATARPGVAGPEELIERADRRMYAAKDAGRDRIQGVPHGVAGEIAALIAVQAVDEPAAADSPMAVRPPASVQRSGARSAAAVQPVSAGMTAFSSSSSDRESYAASGT